MQKLKQLLYRFLYGRYGADEFSRFLLILSGVLFVLYLLSGIEIFYLAFMMSIIYNCFRVYSKNTYKRQQELYAYLDFRKKVNSKITLHKRMWNERKTHRFFSCPGCKTVVRVPKGRGKIEITCPKCHNNFIKKS